ncbi:extracellular solute-binding protein [Paenibacillus sp. LHD-117]|uniref:extracellular solute-binding protein n=1 Tax=Paenibacillus sp. LHD-117 TaxID=3071412 RepID=UPI0027E14BA9|nr:extracellular solute-binding protein [Paenibacillus sp. LHD-117]MDQ6420010.1 extracellular solute-binding protein [Paenibacillus sp. LHD-117]
MRRPLFILIGISLFIIAAVSVSFSRSGTSGGQAVMAGNTQYDVSQIAQLGGSYKRGSYDEYLSKLQSSASRPDVEVKIEGESYASAQDMEVSVVDDSEDGQGQSLLTGDSGTVNWEFEVPKDGLYNLQMNFFIPEGKESDVEREIRIDGKLPFSEARSLVFSRIWKNETNDFIRDHRGNDLIPAQIEAPEWQETLLQDTTGYYTEPYLFYFSKGKHTLSLESVKEPLTIDYFKLINVEEMPTYDQLAAIYKEKGYEEAERFSVKVQGEHTSTKSSPTLLPYNDRTSPANEPFHVSKLRNNAIGGLNWRMPGQWIEWEIEVPKDGLYQIAVKHRQNYLRDGSALRTLYVDGEIPFREARGMAFPYAADWQMGVIGNSADEPYLFYLTEGTHTIRLETTLGDMAPIIRTVESSILQLNAMYRQIISFTGTVPDTFRDYELDKRIPEMTELFAKERDVLFDVAELIDGSGEGSERSAALKTLAHQLNDMAERPDTVPSRIDSFKTNVGGVGNWLNAFKEQPLSIDYLIVSSPGATLPDPEATSLQNVSSGVQSFLASFTEKYDEFSKKDATGETVTVWITTARDQAQIMKRLIDDTFTNETGINVDLRLVGADVVQSATIAGRGPDVALQMGNDIPVNYATRNAVQDLSIFPDFKEVTKRFHESAIVPYEYNGGYFALPEQQTFPVMFYRKDILEDELKLKAPETWEDVYALIPKLQKNKLVFGMPRLSDEATVSVLPPNAAMAMLLFQNGGALYGDDGLVTGLDEEIAIQQFKKWTDLYVNYKLPIRMDFANRFRTGEMPIGIEDYTMYNMLSVFAPEIKGLWEFVPVPGTIDANGQIRRDVGSGGTASVMLKQAKNKEEAWEFMKWWTSAETQLAFGRQMEIRLGTSARYPTANLEAQSLLPWPRRDYEALKEQMDWVRGIPEVPGGYMSGRHIDNAFHSVVVQGNDPRETIENYVRYINEEITLKRKEFNLPYKE